jgi:hypothetical protein
MKDIFLKPGTYSAVIPSKTDFLKGNGQSLQKYLSEYLAASAVCCAKNFVGTSATVSTLTLSSKGAATQQTSITTPVDLNAASGVITTVSTTAAAHTLTVFTVNNSAVALGSIVIASIVDYSGTTGNPSILVEEILAGSFKIAISNGGTGALNGILKIGFVVI